VSIKGVCQHVGEIKVAAGCSGLPAGVPTYSHGHLLTSNGLFLWLLNSLV